MIVLYIYLIIINALGFLLMLIDKYKARKNYWRIPESTLITVALLAGSLGVLFGMQAARHKTKHPKFLIGIPIILLLQAGLALTLFHFFCK